MQKIIKYYIILIILTFYSDVNANSSNSNAYKDSSSNAAAGLSAQYFMISEKIMPGVRAELLPDNIPIGFQFGFSLMYLNSDKMQKVLSGSFLGGLFDIHLFLNLFREQRFNLKIGTGLDAFGLWGINMDEWQYAWPIFIEGRFLITNSLFTFIQPRFYLIESDGMEVGVDRAGENFVPGFLVLGFGGKFR